MNKYVLVIWETNPDGCKFYLIPNPTKKEMEILTKANEKFINCDDDTKFTEILYDALSLKKEFCIDPDSKWACKWANHEISPNKNPIYFNHHCALILIYSGIIL